MAGLLPDRRNSPSTAQTGGFGREKSSPAPDWLSLAQRAYEASTTYVDSNYRKGWEDGIRAFNNMHSTDSKYNHPAYDKRSKLFRPKTRTIIRKNEAAAAAAFFSTMEVTSIQASDPSNQAEVASASIMKEIFQYRLTKTIPWFQLVLGGLQDAQTTGVACAHVYWQYEEKLPANIALNVAEEVMEEAEENPEYPKQTELPEGAFEAKEDEIKEREPPKAIAVVVVQDEPEVLKDQPAIDLIPIENLRIDPGASWVDPVGTSPYIIHLIPMYAMDVKDRMKAGKWKAMSDSQIKSATEITPDSTRITRNKNKDDPYTADVRDVGDYEIVWVQRHIHKHNGEDWDFYTLADIALLTEPVPLKETVFHGRRPYIIGNCNIETHKAMPSSVATLAKALQDETNEVANQRIDNVKFVLNKKWFVKRGREADVNGLLRNVPGGVVMLDDPQNDVKEVTWQDVTASSFQEHQALSMEMDELLGNFNPAALMIGAQNSPAKNMAMLSNSQGTLTEYLLRTYVETFVQPVLRQLMLLEQKYETDRVVLAFAAKRAQLWQRFGIDTVTDELLEKELTLTVNVGMGATDPTAKLNKFIAGITAYTNIMRTPVPGLNVQEVAKEIFGHLGYSDGERFTTNQNPQVLQLQQQLQQAMGVINQLQQRVRDKQMGHQVSLQKARENNQTKIATTQLKEDNENRRQLAQHMRAMIEAQKGLQ